MSPPPQVVNEEDKDGEGQGFMQGVAKAWRRMSFGKHDVKEEKGKEVLVADKKV